MIAFESNNPELRKYMENKQYNPDNLLDKNMYEWELALIYGIQYQKNIRGQISVPQEQLKADRDLIVSRGVPVEMIDYIELFCELDKEYKEYVTEVNGVTQIKDKSWRGYWKKATGNDFSIYIHWIRAGIRQAIKYHSADFINVYLEEHKMIKRTNDIPYCVKMADEIYKKYYKN